MPHGYPGTPVGDLFPERQGVENSGGGLSLRARQHPIQQFLHYLGANSKMCSIEQLGSVLVHRHSDSIVE